MFSATSAVAGAFFSVALPLRSFFFFYIPNAKVSCASSFVFITSLFYWKGGGSLTEVQFLLMARDFFNPSSGHRRSSGSVLVNFEMVFEVRIVVFPGVIPGQKLLSLVGHGVSHGSTSRLHPSHPPLIFALQAEESPQGIHFRATFVGPLHRAPTQWSISSLGFGFHTSQLSFHFGCSFYRFDRGRSHTGPYLIFTFFSHTLREPMAREVPHSPFLLQLFVSCGCAD